eukprot:Skav217423  [mRNA]  locus=scaffold1729:18976:22738:+ [translate_table: standard]
MAAGSRHSMFVTAKDLGRADGSMGSTAGGKVFVWGCNSDGRLGLGHDRSGFTVPVIVAWQQPCGDGERTWRLVLFEEFHDEDWVEALLNHKMVLVAAGEAHSGAVDTNGALDSEGRTVRVQVLTEDGELITFGQGASGRLGTGGKLRGHSKSHKLPVSLGARGFATKLRAQVATESGEKATQKRSTSWGHHQPTKLVFCWYFQ